MSGPGDPCTADAAQVTQIRPRGLPAQEVAPSPCQHRPREPSALRAGPRPTGGHRGASRAPGVTRKIDPELSTRVKRKLPGSSGPRVLPTFPPGVLSGAPHEAPRNARRVCLLPDPSVSGDGHPGPRWCGGLPGRSHASALPQLQLLRDVVPAAPVPAGPPPGICVQDPWPAGAAR